MRSSLSRIPLRRQLGGLTHLRCAGQSIQLIRRDYSADLTPSLVPPDAKSTRTDEQSARIDTSIGVPASTDLLEVYRGLVAMGRLRWDDNQIRLIMKLRDLIDSLADYSPPVSLLSKLEPSMPLSLDPKAGRSQWWRRKAEGDALDAASRDLVKVLSAEQELADLTTPKGILVTGPPGTGKSLLLSLAYNLIPTSKKRRVHYHAFTLSLYRQVFKEMQRRRDEVTEDGRESNRDQASARGYLSVFAGGRFDTEGGREKRVWKREDTIPFVIARDMMLEYHILYFDELQLVDASAASLLRDVLSWYWRLGGIVISCSNRVPDTILQGVQRDRMASFLDALQTRCEVVELDGGRDWRRGDPDKPSQRIPSWFGKGDPRFDDLWLEASGGTAQPQTLSVYSRPLQVPLASDRACRFSFSELCETYLGPADYLTLASTYKCFYIDDIPILTLKEKNEARRMISLVDALYESRCQVVVRAAASPEDLFFPDALEQSSQSDGDQILAEGLTEALNSPARPNVSAYNYAPSEQETDARLGKVGALGVLSAVLGHDEVFSYSRAVSRLIEMTTSPTYPDEEWIPLASESRTWEGASSSSKSASMRSTVTPFVTEDDFGVEAGYLRPQTLTKSPSEDHEPIITHRNQGAGPRKDPPVIKEEHVWGVAEEWGSRAGKWGQGPRAYKKK